ncbi:MAG: ABC transporter permease [Proteobacteria bacterium]|nr:ABC transporter permease [Pseudomonadota bacterium]
MSASFIAQRYLTANRSNRFMSWMTFLSIAGVAIGIASMIVVLSVINGFESELRKRFLAANAHILAFQFPSGLSNVEAMIKTINEDFGSEISGMSPFVHTESMATKDSLMHNILVRGINPERRRAVQELDSYISPKSAINKLQERIDHKDHDALDPIAPIILGTGLASILGLKVGEVINVVRPESNTVGELRAFKVVGIYDSGLKHYDNKIGILAITDAQELLNLGQRVQGIDIGLKDPDNSKDVAARMSSKYTLTIKEWQSFNKSMFEAMEMERSVIGLIVALVAFVASFNILTTLFITVMQKQRSISILKALGASSGRILRIFVFQGFYIGVIGGAAGALLALLISLLLERYDFIDLPDLYLLAHLPIQYDWRIYLTMSLSGALICLLAGVYPAWIAGRTNIVDGFKGRQRAN